jgi:hypothetical protein
MRHKWTIYVHIGKSAESGHCILKFSVEGEQPGAAKSLALATAKKAVRQGVIQNGEDGFIRFYPPHRIELVACKRVDDDDE